MKQSLLAVGLLIGATSFNTNAALTSYIGADGVGLVYSSVSNVTWTQDANLFKTLYDADNNLISKIASVTPSYKDPLWGHQVPISAYHFNTIYGINGSMRWWVTTAFVNYLNHINYGGSDQWRLPSAGSNPQVGYNQTGSELGQLYYSELGALARPGNNGSDYGIFGNGSYNNSGPVGPFVNAHSSVYWSGTEFERNTNGAWDFNTYAGLQDHYHKDAQRYVWPVSPGKVPEIPIPGAIWLMFTGLLGLLGLKRKAFNN